MELIQAKGNTWYLYDWQLIPLYMIDENHCVLLDSGLYEQREAIENTLKQAGIELVGVIGTHVHTDHAGNLFYFQKKYGIPVALPIGEAGLCINELDLKVNFYVFSVRECQEAMDVKSLVGKADFIIGMEDDQIDFCGTTFEIVRLPGHSPDHIGIKTLDNVLYVGDAILAGKDLDVAKLPYHLSVETTMQTIEKLRDVQSDCYLVAHKGVYQDLQEVINQNIQLLDEKCERIVKLIDRPMTLSEVQQSICNDFSLLSSDLRKAELYERTIRGLIEYLRDKDMVSVYAQGGLIYYAPKN